MTATTKYVVCAIVAVACVAIASIVTSLVVFSRVNDLQTTTRKQSSLLVDAGTHQYGVLSTGASQKYWTGYADLNESFALNPLPKLDAHMRVTLQLTLYYDVRIYAAKDLGLWTPGDHYVCKVLFQDSNNFGLPYYGTPFDQRVSIHFTVEDSGAAMSATGVVPLTYHITGRTMLDPVMMLGGIVTTPFSSLKVIQEEAGAIDKASFQIAYSLTWDCSQCS